MDFRPEIEEVEITVEADDKDVPDDSNGIRISLFLIALCGTAQCGWMHISHGNKTGQSDICS